MRCYVFKKKSDIRTRKNGGYSSICYPDLTHPDPIHLDLIHPASNTHGGILNGYRCVVGVQIVIGEQVMYRCTLLLCGCEYSSDFFRNCMSSATEMRCLF